jgi:carbonic anhydrase
VDAFADLFAANANYAAGFSLGDLPAPPSRHVAVITCMDCRIDPLAIFGLGPGDAHVLRNAGARVTDDVLRSLVKSVNQLEVTRVVVMHHNDCGAAKIKLPTLRAKVVEATGNDPAEVDFHLIDDQDESLRADVEAVQRCPYLPPGTEVVGLLYDVTTGVAGVRLSAVVAEPAAPDAAAVRRRGSG